MMHEVIAHGAHDGSPELAHSPGTRHNKRTLLFIGKFDDDLAWFSGSGSELTNELK